MLQYQPEYVHCEDAHIACYDIGSGAPLVLLHGNGEDSGYFKAQMPEFSKFYRVLAIDSRGHGCSESGLRGLSFDVMARDLKMVLDARGISKAHILGFSDGGNLAIKFALEYPAYVDKLVLNGANVDMLGGVKPQVQLPLYPVYGLLHALSRVSKHAAHRRDVLGLMVHPYGVRMVDLQRLHMPTLLIVGERDMIRQEETHKMLRQLPNSRLAVFRDGDHFVAAKQPARFNRTVIEFLMER